MNIPTLQSLLSPVAQAGTKSATSSHLVFVDVTAEEAQLRVQEILLHKPRLSFQVHQLTPDDLVGQMTECLKKHKAEPVRSLWLITGREIETTAENPILRSENRSFKLDKRIAEWQSVLDQGAVCYLLGSGTSELGQQITRQTSAAVRYDFDAASSTILDEVLFLDPSITNFDAAVQEILLERDVEIISLDCRTDGVFQIADYLRQRRGLKAIHLFCPGDGASLTLGGCCLTSSSISNEHRDALKTVATCLAKDAEIRIYNRNFHSGVQRDQIVNELSDLTGAFVIVSNSQATAWVTSDLLDQSLIVQRPAGQARQLWNQLLPPLQRASSPAEQSSIECKNVIDSCPVESDFQDERVVRYEFDQVQAAGWLCVGFATGCVTALFFVWCGLWI